MDQLALVDFRKAFEKLWRDGLFYKLHKYGIKGKMFRMIQECYRGTKSSVVVDGCDSKVFGINGGVSKGKQLAISHTSEYKYLSVMVNEKWDRSTHINYVTTKVTLMRGLLQPSQIAANQQQTQALIDNMKNAKMSKNHPKKSFLSEFGASQSGGNLGSNSCDDIFLFSSHGKMFYKSPPSFSKKIDNTSPVIMEEFLVNGSGNNKTNNKSLPHKEKSGFASPGPSPSFFQYQSRTPLLQQSQESNLKFKKTVSTSDLPQEPQQYDQQQQQQQQQCSSISKEHNHLLYEKLLPHHKEQQQLEQQQHQQHQHQPHSQPTVSITIDKISDSHDLNENIILGKTEKKNQRSSSSRTTTMEDDIQSRIEAKDERRKQEGQNPILYSFSPF
eukprot:Awhi_evm1s14977